eukprot:scaffold1642_cov252-Pinguiococcus_pyrenoidosus.AAC.13
MRRPGEFEAGFGAAISAQHGRLRRRSAILSRNGDGPTCGAGQSRRRRHAVRAAARVGDGLSGVRRAPPLPAYRPARLRTSDSLVSDRRFPVHNRDSLPASKFLKYDEAKMPSSPADASGGQTTEVGGGIRPRSTSTSSTPLQELREENARRCAID